MKTIYAKDEKNSKGVILRNIGFGNRCCIDGSFFDDGGICSQGHQIGELYIGQAPEVEESKKPSKKENLPNTKDAKNSEGVILRNIGFGNRCYIDGSFFDDGGICSQGHQIGAVYGKASQN